MPTGAELAKEIEAYEREVRLLARRPLSLVIFIMQLLTSSAFERLWFIRI